MKDDAYLCVSSCGVPGRPGTSWDALGRPNTSETQWDGSPWDGAGSESKFYSAPSMLKFLSIL